MTISYARGVGQTDAHPVNLVAPDFNSFCAAVVSDRQAAKGLGYICAPMSDGHRCKASAMPRRWIGLDLDGCTPEQFAMLLQSLQAYSCLVYTTASSTAECPRARIIVELTMPIGRDAGKAVSAALRNTLGAELKWDSACDRAEQPLFLPLHSAQHWRFTGAPLVPVLVPLTPAKPAITVIPPAHPLAVLAAQDDMTRVVARIADAAPGERNHVLNKAAHALGGYVGAGRLDAVEVRTALLAAVVGAQWQDLDGCARKVDAAIKSGAKEPRVLHVAALPEMPAPSAAPVASGALVILSAADITPEPIHWIWDGWLASGKLHLLAGQSGCGKTTLALALAATLTNGSRWPDGSIAPRGDVLVWSGEDDAATTLVPRAMACGARLSGVHFLSGVMEGGRQTAFDPSLHLPQLSAQLAAGLRIKLLIVDPIVSAVTGDSHKNSEVRRALEPLVHLAAQYDFAIIGITHLTKGTQGQNPTERITGSLAFAALARVVLIAAKSEASDEHAASYALARAKSNIGPDWGGFAYDLERVTVGAGVAGQRVVWGDALDGTTREVLGGLEANDEDTNAAADWLRNLLSRAPTGIVASEIFNAGGIAGHSRRKLQRARTKLKITTTKFNDGWVWKFPVEAGSQGKVPLS